MKPRQKLTGIKRLTKALQHSWDGLAAAYKAEQAFRQEVWLACALLPASLFVNASAAGHAILVASVFVLLIAELLNTAVEATVDRISQDEHPLSKIAKDVASAAILLALVNLVCTWLAVIFIKPRFFG